MMKQLTVRPARAAIAAVLALAPTSLLAQEVAPAAPPPVTVTQTAPPPVVVAPVIAAPSPVVQPIPAPAPVVADTAPEVTSAPRLAKEKPSPERAAPVRASTVSPRVATPAPADAAPEADSSPIAPVAEAPVAQQIAPTPASAPIEPATSNAGNGLEWGLVGGAAVLITGLGLLATRRRRRPEQDEVLAFEPTQSLASLEPVAARTTYSPVAAMTMTAAIQPARIYERSTSTSVPSHGGHGNLEAMAAAAPSPANPFLTRKNRLRRAHFLLRQQQTPIHQDMPNAATIVSAQQDRRQSVTYDFGRNPGKRPAFRPATT